jgi:hypothetical protein
MLFIPRELNISHPTSGNSGTVQCRYLALANCPAQIPTPDPNYPQSATSFYITPISLQNFRENKAVKEQGRFLTYPLTFIA